jgi:hypothetical protein
MVDFDNNLGNSGGSFVGLVIVQSEIEFFINNSLKYNCSRALIHPIPSAPQPYAFTFFNSFDIVQFATKNRYPAQPICPYLFVYASSDMIIQNQIDTILIVNLVKGRYRISM